MLERPSMWVKKLVVIVSQKPLVAELPVSPPG